MLSNRTKADSEWCKSIQITDLKHSISSMFIWCMYHGLQQILLWHLSYCMSDAAKIWCDNYWILTSSTFGQRKRWLTNILSLLTKSIFLKWHSLKVIDSFLEIQTNGTEVVKLGGRNGTNVHSKTHRSWFYILIAYNSLKMTLSAKLWVVLKI